MKQKDLDKITRLEVIDYRNEYIGENRAYVSGIDDNMKIEFCVQDDDRTLKIFIQDKEPRSKPANVAVLKHVLKKFLTYDQYMHILKEYSALADYTAEDV